MKPISKVTEFLVTIIILMISLEFLSSLIKFSLQILGIYIFFLWKIEEFIWVETFFYF